MNSQRLTTLRDMANMMVTMSGEAHHAGMSSLSQKMMKLAWQTSNAGIDLANLISAYDRATAMDDAETSNGDASNDSPG
jgi:hypothetical protein